MSLLRVLGLAPRASKPPSEPERVSEPPAEEGRAVFQDAALLLDDFHHVRVIVTHITERGARLAFFARVEVPFRVRISAPSLKLKCWARVVWQDESAAELEFQADEA